MFHARTTVAFVAVVALLAVSSVAQAQTASVGKDSAPSQTAYRDCLERRGF